MNSSKIIIRGLKQNNLKNISLEIPKNKIVVFTGVSGSGKSSIVFETLAAESQRQMNETYSAWVRGRLPKYEKPNVEFIDNNSFHDRFIMFIIVQIAVFSYYYCMIILSTMRRNIYYVISLCI